MSQFLSYELYAHTYVHTYLSTQSQNTISFPHVCSHYRMMMIVKVVLVCLPGNHILMKTTWTLGPVMMILLGTTTLTQTFVQQHEILLLLYHFIFTIQLKQSLIVFRNRSPDIIMLRPVCGFGTNCCANKFKSYR